jgi:3-phosphoshikimate 1-carboxyvinyltransferase
VPAPPITIDPLPPFDATVSLPGSKSLTNRALLLAALAEGASVLEGVLLADDTRVMLDALQQLGVRIDLDEADHRATVHGVAGRWPNDNVKLHLGNAGTATRFLTAACCLGHGTYEIDGVARMRQRPIDQLVEPLRELGADITYLGDAGYPPLRIQADGLEGGPLTLGPTLSSQFISALLQVAPRTARGITLTFDGPVTSLPYVQMTLSLMEHFGVEYQQRNHYEAVRVSRAVYRRRPVTIEPDASNASYFLAAAAAVPGSTCTVQGLGGSSVQGDAAFVDVLGRMGCHVEQRDLSTTVSTTPGHRLKAVDIDLNDMPDTAQTLAPLSLFADGTTHIRNVGNLRIKETDRMAALQTELTKLGAQVRVTGDDLSITPPPNNQITPAAIDTYDDHRMAMGFAMAGLPQGSVTINDPDCVNKTFPDFFDTLATLRPPPQASPPV